MGASFCTLTLPGTLTPDGLREEFRKIQDADRHENGHSYSGTIGMANGLLVVTTPIRDSYQAAEGHLDAVAKKWGPAVAIRFRPSPTEKDPAPAVEWLIGAWCSS